MIDFLNDLFEQIHFHVEYQSLQKFIPSDILPESLGGSMSEDKAWDIDLIQRLFQREKFYKGRCIFHFIIHHFWCT